MGFKIPSGGVYMQRLHFHVMQRMFTMDSIQHLMDTLTQTQTLRVDTAEHISTYHIPRFKRVLFRYVIYESTDEPEIIPASRTERFLFVTRLSPCGLHLEMKIHFSCSFHQNMSTFHTIV